MDFERHERVDAPWAGPTAALCGLLATLSWGCCGVLGPVGWLLALGFTAGAAGAGFIGLRRSPPGGDTHAFAIIGLVLAFLNGLLLLVGLLFQLGVAGMVFAVLFAEGMR